MGAVEKCPGCNKQVHLDCAIAQNAMVDTATGMLVKDAEKQVLPYLFHLQMNSFVIVAWHVRMWL